MTRKKAFWSVAVLILGTCLVTFCYSRARTAEGLRLLEKGRAAFSSGAYGEAVTDLSKALQLNPRTGQIYVDRAAAYQKKGEEEKALEDYNVAIQLGSTATQIYVARGLIFFKQGEWEKSTTDLSEAIRRGAVDANVFIKHARSRAALQDIDAAIAGLDAALQLEAKNPEARELRGDLHFKKGDVGKAMDDYGELRTSQGESGALQRERQWAAATARIAAPQNNAMSNSLFEKARIAGENSRFEEAIQFYNTLLQMDLPLPLASTACQNRGNAYGAMNDDDAALRDYDQAIRFNPANAGAYVNRGVILSKRGDHNGAVMDYNEAIRLDPKLHQAFFNRALARRGQGDLDSARRDLTKAIRLEAKFAAAYANRGAVHHEQRKFDLALSDYETAIKIDPALAEAYLGRANIFSQRRLYARAATDLEKAVQLRPRGDLVLNALAWLRATCPSNGVRDGKKSIAAALQACELRNWANFAHVDTLAAAYAENREFANAVDFQWYGLSLESVEEKDRAGAEERLKLYQQRRPYREREPQP